MNKPGRNDSCPCGSGKKYKKCCLPKEEAALPRSMFPEQEKNFMVELRPELDDAVDRLLQRMELGAGSRLQSEIAALYEKHPGYHMTNFAMGVYKAMGEKDPRGAIPFFERAVQIFPAFPEAHFNLGNSAMQAFDIIKAVAAYRMAERYSQSGDGIAEMARNSLRALERIVLTTTSFTNLEAYLANARLFNQAFECLAGFQFERAVELFQRVLSESPKHVQSYGNMALAYAGLGRRSEAMACFERALELDPGYEPALVNRRRLEEMREGEPFIPDGIESVEYYADRMRQTSRGGH